MCDTMKVTFLNMWLCGHVGNQCVKPGSFRGAEFRAALGIMWKIREKGEDSRVESKPEALMLCCRHLC